MSLRCLSHQHCDHLFAENSPATPEEPFFGQRVILFDPRVERGSQSIGERWRRLDSAKRAVDLVVVRGSSQHFAEQVEQDAVFRQTVGDVPVLILAGSWDEAEREPRLSRPTWSRESPIQVDVDVLRTFELLTLLLESRAVYRHRGCHFRLPSSRIHAEAFIRLADALDDHTDLVRVADWVFPYASDGTALLGDNGSLLGLLSVVSHQALVRFGWTTVPVATLNEYPADTEAIRKFVDGFRAQDWSRLIFLITVSSSGSIADRVAAVEEVDEVIVLCETGPTAEDSRVCFTRHHVERWAAGPNQSCAVCKDLHTLIIDPRTYEVRVDISTTREGIDLDEATRTAPFWEAVDRRDAVALHRQVDTAEGNPAGSRHLAVAIDVPSLLGDDRFRAWCIDALRKQPRPDLVVIPRHSATNAVADVVGEAHGLDPGEVVSVAIGDFDQELVERLRASERVLVADDVVVTAETLVTLRRRIYDTHGTVEVWGFVPVMRPPSQLELDHVSRPYKGPSEDGGARLRLTWGFHLFLPAPGDEACPWCSERDLLNERLSGLKGIAARVAAERLDRLRSSSGLEAPLLLIGDVADKRTDESFFGGLRPKAAFAAASGVAQRQKDFFHRDRTPNELRIFNVTLAIDAFFDTVLFAGLMRTFDPRDLRGDRSYDEEVDRALGEYQMNGGTVAEAAFAAVTGKVPPECVRKRLADADLGDVAELLAELLS